MSSELLRPGLPSDLEALVALEQRGFGAGAWSPSQVAGGLEREAGLVVVLVGPGEGLLASATGWVAAGEAELERIVVAPEARRRGRGGRLLLAFARAARGRGAERLFLEVRADNDPAIGLYEGLGFTGIGRRPAYYADGGTALLYALDLRTGPAPPPAQKPGLKR